MTMKLSEADPMLYVFSIDRVDQSRLLLFEKLEDIKWEVQL